MEYKCDLCNETKPTSEFKKAKEVPGTNGQYIFCDVCMSRFRLKGFMRTNYNGEFELPLDIKIRECLKCDEEFLSIDQYRLCDKCQTQNRYCSEMDWDSISGFVEDRYLSLDDTNDD